VGSAGTASGQGGQNPSRVKNEGRTDSWNIMVNQLPIRLCAASKPLKRS